MCGGKDKMKSDLKIELAAARTAFLAAVSAESAIF